MTVTSISRRSTTILPYLVLALDAIFITVSVSWLIALIMFTRTYPSTSVSIDDSTMHFIAFWALPLMIFAPSVVASLTMASDRITTRRYERKFGGRRITFRATGDLSGIAMLAVAVFLLAIAATGATSDQDPDVGVVIWSFPWIGSLTLMVSALIHRRKQPRSTALIAGIIWWLSSIALAISLANMLGQL